MRNRTAGFVLIGVSALIGFIIFSFNRAMEDIVNASCSHGPACPMWGTIRFQTNISIAIMLFVIAIGSYLVFFSKEPEKIRQVKSKKITKKAYENILSKLKQDEQTVLEKIIESEGTIFQSNLVEKTQFTKVKVTRILDKLEGKDLIERRRRGMTNVVILKN